MVLLFHPVRLNDSWKKALYDQVNSLGVVEMLGVNCSLLMDNWVVLSIFFYFHTYLGKISNLSHIFQIGWFNPVVVG